MTYKTIPEIHYVTKSNALFFKVTVIESENGITHYRIWMDPETRSLYTECPWMAPSSSKNKYYCLIQDVKPEICRHYPFTRKHAVMTGCKGKFVDQP